MSPTIGNIYQEGVCWPLGKIERVTDCRRQQGITMVDEAVFLIEKLLLYTLRF